MSPRPRVLHVIDSLAAGGLELRLPVLFEGSRDHFEHSICCLRETGAPQDRFTTAGADVTFIGKAEGQDWSVPWRIARLCRRLRPDVVHTRNWGAIEGVLAARLAGVPVIIHGEHGRETAIRSAHDGRRDCARRLLFRFADRIVVVSKHLERWLLQEVGVRAHKAVFIANGVDTDRFRPDPDRERRRREYGYQPEDVVIGALGRLSSIKDHATLISAFDMARRCDSRLRLVIVGEGPQRATLQADIRQRGLEQSTRLVGHQDDVRTWLAAMDLFVHTSLFEGMSNAILEAMSLALPVVATRVGGTPELVQEGVTGRLVDAGDAASAAEAISFYVRTPAARVSHGRAGRDRVMEQYPLSRMIDAYVALYSDALRRRRADTAG